MGTVAGARIQRSTKNGAAFDRADRSSKLCGGPGRTSVLSGHQETECRELLVRIRETGAVTVERRYRAGDVIYREGDHADALYILVEGTLKMVSANAEGKDVTLHLLDSWESFGNLAFAGEPVQRTTAEAVTDCRVVKVPRVFLERAVRSRPEVAFRVITLLEHRLVQHEELAGCLLPRRTEARLAALLPMLASKFGTRSGGQALTIDMRLTQRELGAMIGSSRESVSMAVNDLRRRRAIDVERGRLILLSPEHLAQITRR